MTTPTNAPRPDHAAEARHIAAQHAAGVAAYQLAHSRSLSDAQRRQLLQETAAGRAQLAELDRQARPGRATPGTAAMSATPANDALAAALLARMVTPAATLTATPAATFSADTSPADQAEATGFADHLVTIGKATAAECSAIAAAAAQALADDRRAPRPATERTRAQTLAQLYEHRGRPPMDPARRDALLSSMGVPPLEDNRQDTPAMAPGKHDDRMRRMGLLR